MVRWLTEFLGTFGLVFTIGLSVANSPALAPLWIGGGLTVLIYLGGRISGAHYNPAVSLAFLMRGSMPPRELFPYLVSQLAGALVASGATYAIVGRAFVLAPGDGVHALAAFAIEILATFVLALVILIVATHPRTAGNRYYGLAIGGTIVVLILAGGAVSGGAYNPAVGVAPNLLAAIAEGAPMGHVWLYVVGPAFGGALAALVFRRRFVDV